MENPWDQQPDESDEAYVRFLIYRNLGPCRSLRRAYFQYLQEYDGYQGGIKGINPPHNWRGDCCDRKWVERSSAWDVRNLVTYGSRIAVMHAEAVAAVARKNLKYAKILKPGDEGYLDLITSMRTVGAFLSPELVSSIEAKHKPARPLASASVGRAREQVE